MITILKIYGYHVTYKLLCMKRIVKLAGIGPKFAGLIVDSFNEVVK